MSVFEVTYSSWNFSFVLMCYLCFACRGENVEDVFIETAKKIYQNIQDGK